LRQILGVGKDQFEPAAQQGGALLRRLRLPCRQGRAAASIARVVSAAAINGTSAIIRPSAGSLTDGQRAAIVGGFPATIEVAFERSRRGSARCMAFPRNLKNRSLYCRTCVSTSSPPAPCRCCSLACASQAPAPRSAPPRIAERPAASAKGNDVVIFALGLIDTGYRFGGKNPEAGLDCSGMVSYIYQGAAGLR
jgi:hypothetical protein